MNKRLLRYTQILTLGAGYACATSTASANLLAYDNYSYGLTDGASLVFASPTGSTGFSGVWQPSSGTPAQDATWRSGGLTYTDRKGATLGGVGGHLHLSGLAAGNVFMRLNFSQDTIAAVNANGGAYFSFLSQRTGPVTNDPSFGTTQYPRNFGARIMTSETSLNNAAATIGQASYGGGGTRNHLDEWAVANFDTVAYASTGVPFYTQVDLVVGKVDFNANTITLWINPDLDDISINDGSVVAADTGNGVSAWVALGLEAGSDGTPRRGAEFIMDEFRLGTTFEAVGVPEPSTYAMIIGLLAAGFVALRRRRQ